MKRNGKMEKDKINIFEKELLFFPINYYHNYHFFLFVVHIKKKLIFYFNSQTDQNNEIMNKFSKQIIRYLNDEYTNQKIVGDFNVNNFKTTINMKNHGSQLQNDGSSCGVFVCMWMDFLSHGYDYKCVEHDKMPHFRLYIAVSLKEGF